MVSRTVIIGKYVEFKYCECGCQKTLSKYYIQPDGRVRKEKERSFIHGHHFKVIGNPMLGKKGKDNPNFGRKHSEESKKKMGEMKRKNHPMKGKHLPEEWRRKIGLGQPLGEKHHNWVGDNVKNGGLHAWVKRHFPKSEHEICMLCHNNPSEELANITGIYKRPFKNWAWFCLPCHMEYDNILERTILLANRKKHERAEAKKITLA
jgi:hypothetical protein